MRARLEEDLRDAMKRRDNAAVAILRTLIGAIDNAGAVEPGPAWPPVVNRRADVPRRELSDVDIRAIISREAEELSSAISEYEAIGRDNEAAELREKLRVAQRYTGQ